MIVNSPEVREQLAESAPLNRSKIMSCSHLLLVAHLKTVSVAYIDRHFDYMAEVRAVPPASIQSFRDMVMGPPHGPPVMAQTSQGQTSTVQPNSTSQPGSTVATTKTSVVSEMYDAYGTRTGTAAPPDPFGYEAQAGYYTDTETGLVLCTHRFYDPSNGRWLTRDPIGYEGDINLYGYCENDPTNNSDPSGYDPSFGGQDPTQPFPISGTGSPGKGTTIGITGGGGAGTTLTGGYGGGANTGIKIGYMPPGNMQPPGVTSPGNGSITGIGTLPIGSGGGYVSGGGGSTLGGPGTTNQYGFGFNPPSGFGGGFTNGNTFGGKKGPTNTKTGTITDKPAPGWTVSCTATLTNGTLSGGTLKIGYSPK